eukprot:CAMPEP_0202909834 /NCGR_PEP_ID=MMETSP1392-20130828/50387_1 /ASSEMBLY_ACC=CAM_ASM_000868 /TAXON_ID=225041 /ORGANISM="Chlamydomonas chlamydogama, Strain SAG 11-48b" /LENGTH=68 /DNA_ID=CAMNT_0049599711 /DNA_START=16 /DNA_END=219 /DNA_ORIENTATION=+
MSMVSALIEGSTECLGMQQAGDSAPPTRCVLCPQLQRNTNYTLLLVASTGHADSKVQVMNVTTAARPV